MSIRQACAAFLLSFAVPVSILADDKDVIAGLENLGARSRGDEMDRLPGWMSTAKR